MTESRPQLIWRHVHAFIHKTSTSWPTYATEVREHYEQLVPEPQRLIEFSRKADLNDRARLDAQTLRRLGPDYPNSTCEFDLPALIEEAMVRALGTLGYAHYDRLMAELAERYGMLAAVIPHGTAEDDVKSAGRLLKETGEAVTALGPLLGDNRIDEKDDPKQLEEADRQVLEAIGALASVRERIAEARARQRNGRLAS